MNDVGAKLIDLRDIRWTVVVIVAQLDVCLVTARQWQKRISEDQSGRSVLCLLEVVSGRRRIHKCRVRAMRVLVMMVMLMSGNMDNRGGQLDSARHS